MVHEPFRCLMTHHYMGSLAGPHTTASSGAWYTINVARNVLCGAFLAHGLVVDFCLISVKIKGQEGISVV